MGHLMQCCPLVRKELSLLHHGIIHTAACQNLVQTNVQRQYNQLARTETTLCRNHRCMNNTQLRHVHNGFNPVDNAYTYLNWVHDSLGAPWWLSIAIAVIPLRVVLGVICQRYGHHNSMKEGPLKQVMAARARQLMPELQRASAQFKWTEEQRMKAQRIQLMKIQKKEMIKLGYHPLKSIIIILPTLPIWISMSWSLFKMVGKRGTPGDINPNFATEGALWFPDLMVPDATLLIPFVFMLTSLANTEVHDLSRNQEQHRNKFFTTLTWVMRSFSVFLFFIATQMPTALPLYWTYSTIAALGVNLILMSPSFRSLNYPMMPQLKTDNLTPYSDLYTAAKKRYDVRRFIRKDS